MPIDLEVEGGALVAVAGRSGAGKSTLLGLLAGLFPATEGRVLLDGVDIARLGDGARARLRRRVVALAPQNPTLLPDRSARANVLLASPTGGRRFAEEAGEVLAALGLAAAADRPAATLSGGEAARVALARAIVAGTPLLLADEPTGELDDDTAAAVLGLLDARRGESGRAVVIATHDARILQRADRVVRLASGAPA